MTPPLFPLFKNFLWLFFNYFFRKEVMGIKGGGGGYCLESVTGKLPFKSLGSNMCQLINFKSLFFSAFFSYTHCIMFIFTSLSLNKISLTAEAKRFSSKIPPSLDFFAKYFLFKTKIKKGGGSTLTSQQHKCS